MREMVRVGCHGDVEWEGVSCVSSRGPAGIPDSKRTNWRGGRIVQQPMKREVDQDEGVCEFDPARWKSFEGV